MAVQLTSAYDLRRAARNSTVDSSGPSARVESDLDSAEFALDLAPADNAIMLDSADVATLTHHIVAEYLGIPLRFQVRCCSQLS
jgi:hypothetical protein